MSYVHFTVPGTPAPQGSKTPWGTEANPNTRPWRATVAAEATEAIKGRDPFTGPVRLGVVFFFPRPKAHYGTGRNAAKLKDSAPAYCATKPDADKLVRAIGDALTGIVVRDDCLIAELHATKRYGQPHASVTVLPLDAPFVLRGSPFAKAAA